MRRLMMVIVAGWSMTGAAGCQRTTTFRPKPARVVGVDAGPVTAGTRLPAEPIVAADFGYAITIYHLPRPKQDPRAVLARLAAKQSELALLATGPHEAPPRPSVWLVQHSDTEHRPPSSTIVEHFGRGLTEGDKKLLARSRASSVLMFGGPGISALASYRRAVALVEAFTQATGGLVYDDETRLVHGPSSWATVGRAFDDGGLPDARAHLTIHAYREGELLRMITLGMRKFALPDLVVNQVSASDTPMGTMVNLLAQRLVEGAAPTGEGRLALALDDVENAGVRRSIEETILENAKRRATVQLAVGKRDEGDPDNRLIEVVFPGAAGGLQERQGALLDDLFGSKDSITSVEYDKELLAASARARKTVLGYKTRYAGGIPTGEHLLVKAPFATRDGSTEWMWIEVVRWEGRKIVGILKNDPFEVPGLKAGARVSAEESSLFDYILVKPDGSREGNETAALLEKQQRPQKQPP